MELKNNKCVNCGGSSFNKKDDCYECEFCGSKYTIEKDETIVSKTLTDTKIVECYIEASKHMLANNHVEELKELTKALELDPNNALTFVKLGRCYRCLGMQDKAVESYKKALEIDPETGSAYTNMGTIYIINKNWSEAAKQYEKGLPYLNETQEDYWVAYANYAIVIAQLGDKGKAEKMIAVAEQHGYKNGDGCRALAGINNKKQGCYVASCVYGSYDCPQVWTLRRFRDNTLARTLPGRAFIRTYYAISPTLVKWFGNTTWFKKLWKGVLDKMINKLKTNGVEDTPYRDREW